MTRIKRQVQRSTGKLIGASVRKALRTRRKMRRDVTCEVMVQTVFTRAIRIDALNSTLIVVPAGK